MTSLILVKFNLQNALYIGEVNEKRKIGGYTFVYVNDDKEEANE